MKNTLLIFGLLWALSASGQIYIDSYRFAQVTGFDADYQAVLNRATALGYALPSAAQQILQNQLVLDLKSAGVWTKLDVLYIFANDSGADFATLNWKNPNAHQATAVNSPVFTTNVGFTGNATNQQYIDTNFNPATSGVNYTLNNAGRFVWVSAQSGTGPFDGNSTGGSNRILNANSASQSINSGNINTAIDFGQINAWRAINRVNSSDVVAFTSTTRFDRTATSTSVASLNQWVLRTATVYGLHTINFYAMGASCVSENDTFRDAISNYMASL